MSDDFDFEPQEAYEVTAFRLRGKSLFLTYPRCGVEKVDLLAYLRQLFLAKFSAKIEKYIIATELHEDGEPHIHCFIGLDTSLDKPTTSDVFNFQTFHPNIQPARNNRAVICYVSKGSDYITNIGKLVDRYRAEKLKEREVIARELMNGTPLCECVQKYPKLLFGYARLKQDIQAYQLDKIKPVDLDRPCGVWIHGPGNAGKSTIARTRFGDIYDKGKNKWWDGYDGKRAVVCEDVDHSWKDGEVYTFFKWWADKWSFIAETKNGTIRIRPPKLIVTSNFTLEECLTKWGLPDTEWYPYQRRFTQYRIERESDWDDQL